MRNRQAKPNVWIRARITVFTDKAIRIKPANQDEQFWLPKSQVVNMDDIVAYLTSLPEEEAKVEYVDIEAKEWIVTKNGIPTVEETGKEKDDDESEEAWDDDTPF